jgi:hypothetical protein
MVLASGASLAGAATTKAPTTFAGRANSACATAGAKILALPTPTAATVVSDVRSTQAIVTKLVLALKAIKAPTKQAKAYAAFVASNQQEATILKQTLAAFNANQTSKLTKLGDQAATVLRRSTGQAKALGLVACSKTYSPSKMSSTAKQTTTTPAATTSHLTDAPVTTAVPATTPSVTPAPAAATTTGAAGGTSGSSVSTGNSSQSASQNSSNTQSGGQSVGGGVLLS